MTRLRYRFLAVLIVALFGASAAVAQTVPTPAAPGPLEGVRLTLDQIDNALQRPDLGDAGLVEVRSRLEPLSEQVRTTIEERAPKLDAVKARLDQLGPKPAANATPEGPAVTAERDEQQKQFDDLDASIKRGKLLGLRIEQTADAIVSRRRGLFARALFARSYSLFSPELWIAVAKEAPVDARAVSFVTADWISGMANWLRGARLFWFLALIACIPVLYAVMARIERRVVYRDPAKHDPPEPKKSLAAVWTFAVTASVPIFVAIALLGLLQVFDLSNPRMAPLVVALSDTVVRVALALGLTRGLLAPELAGWRLVGWPDAIVARLGRVALAVVAALSVIKIADAGVDIIGASLPMSIALRGVGAALVALVMVAGLRRLSSTPADDDDCLGPRVVPQRDWTVALRAFSWLSAAAILLSALAGYVAFAAFIADQFVWVVFVGCMLFMLNRAVQESIVAALQPTSRTGRAFLVNLGLRRDSLAQICVLLSGVATLTLLIAAALLALAPWGVESNDMLANARAAFFGFTVGGITISLESIFLSVLVFAAAWGVARALRNWLDVRFLPHTSLDTGLRNSIKTSVGYVGFVLAASLALAYLGLSFDKLAIIAGALSVGIGFGLQSIVNNFVSGLILLWERAIRVGDWVVVGEDQGYIRRINVRSTEIETFDRATMIVPNSNLVTGVVKNWVRNDRVGRIKNSVTVNVGADPEKVREAMLMCAKAHELVLKIPAPQVMFASMSDNMLRFELVSFVSEVEKSAQIKSDLNYSVFQSFIAAQIDLAIGAPPPPPPAPA